MSKEVNLLEYWMPILRGLKEFKQIAKTETIELKYLLDAIDCAINNMFIETADEYGIGRFEEILGIIPNKEDPLELRRANVQIKWNSVASYTYKELYNKLLAICGGEDKFSITEYFNEYSIEINTWLETQGVFDSVSDFLVEVLPCNLVLTLNNFLEETCETAVDVSVVTTTATVFTLS